LKRKQKIRIYDLILYFGHAELPGAVNLRQRWRSQSRSRRSRGF